MPCNSRWWFGKTSKVLSGLLKLSRNRRTTRERDIGVGIGREKSEPVQWFCVPSVSFWLSSAPSITGQRECDRQTEIQKCFIVQFLTHSPSTHVCYYAVCLSVFPPFPSIIVLTIFSILLLRGASSVKWLWVHAWYTVYNWEIQVKSMFWISSCFIA